MKSGWLLLFVACAPVEVEAARPLATEDTGTLGRGNYQLELGSSQARDRTNAGDDRELRYSAQLAYGAREQVDVAIGVPWIRREPPDLAAATGRGVGDIELNFEMALLRASRFQLGCSAGYEAARR